MPAPLLPPGFDDVVLTNAVEILNDFSTQQSAIDAGVAFTAERDRLTAPSADELASGPIVSAYVVNSNPASGASRDQDVSTVMVQFDLYVAMVDGTGGGDKAAMARLYYLKDQVRAALFAKSATDLGFTTGTVGKKRWGRFQNTPQGVPGEVWICAGQLTVEIDYSYDAQDLDMVDLEQVNVTALKDFPQAAAYSTRWAGLYNVG